MIPRDQRVMLVELCRSAYANRPKLSRAVPIQPTNRSDGVGFPTPSDTP